MPYDPVVGASHRETIRETFQRLSYAYETPAEIPAHTQAKIDQMVAGRQEELPRSAIEILGSLTCAFLYDAAKDGSTWGPLHAVVFFEALCRATE